MMCKPQVTELLSKIAFADINTVTDDMIAGRVPSDPAAVRRITYGPKGMIVVHLRNRFAALSKLQRRLTNA